MLRLTRFARAQRYMGMDTSHSPAMSPTAARAAGYGLPRIPLAPVAEQTDEQLMLEYAAGSASAFDQLYDRYRGPLYRFILRLVKDPVTTNDLYQLTWEKVIKARMGYRSKSPFAAWLFRIARNNVMDLFRKQSRQPGDELVDTASTSPGPEDFALKRESESKLAAAIDALPPEQREVIVLRLESGLDLAAIAAITNSSFETSKSRLRYALAKLKALMQEQPAIPGEHHESA